MKIFATPDETGDRENASSDLEAEIRIKSLRLLVYDLLAANQTLRDALLKANQT